MTVVTTSGPPTPKPKRDHRLGIFIYDLVVLAILLIIAVLYLLHPTWFDLGEHLPNPPHPNVNLSIHCLWFGALGGIIISLKGVYDHAVGASTNPWDDNFNLWHIGRPFSGAMAGLMTVVLLLSFNPGGGLTEPLVYAAAFIFGTQERRFFDLLSQVAGLIVHVPEQAKTTRLTITDVQPAEAAAGDKITITGTGFDAKATATLGTAAVGNLVVSKDGTSAAGVVPARPTGGADLVDVAVKNPDGATVTWDKKFKYKS